MEGRHKPAPSLGDLPADVQLLIAAHLMKKSFGALLELVATCRTLKELITVWLWKQTQCDLNSSKLMGDLGSPGEEGQDSVDRILESAVALEYWLPSLRRLRLGGSTVLVEFLRKASVKRHTLDLGPMLRSVSRVEEELAICLFAACYIQDGWQAGLQAVRFGLPRRTHARLRLWPPRPVRLNYIADDPLSELGQRGAIVLGALLASNFNGCGIGRLQELRLDNNDIGMMGAQAIGVGLARRRGAACGAHLKVLGLVNNGLDGMGLAHVLGLDARALPRLECLDLAHNDELGSYGAGILAYCINAGSLRKLKLLNVHNCALGGSGALELFAVLKKLPQLSWLTASCNSIPDDALAALGGALGSGEMPWLRRLNVGGQTGSGFYGDEGVCALAEGLTAFDGNVEVEGREGGASSQLEALLLCKYRLSDRGMLTLANMARDPRNLPQLHTLEVAGTAEILLPAYTVMGVESLRHAVQQRVTAMPGARLAFKGPTPPSHLATMVLATEPGLP